MTSLPAMSPEEQNVVEFAESPGRRLRVQRQAKGLDIERVAAQLHLRRAMVEALEQDRYHELPGPVFVVGYLRNYARVLGLDPAPVVDAYRASHPEPQATLPRVPEPPRREIGSSHILVRLVSLALVVAVIAMIALWWMNRAETLTSLPLTGEGVAPEMAGGEMAQPHESAAGEDTLGLDAPRSAPAAPMSTPGGLTLPSPAVPGPAGGPAPLADAPATTADTGPGAGLDEAPASPRTPIRTAPEPLAEVGATAPGSLEAAAEGAAEQATGEAVAESLESAPAGPPEVALSFSGPCWIEVKDAAGSVVLTGSMREGDRRVLDGQPPYKLIVGNAANTAITVGGEPFDLAARSRGNVARFTLDPGAAQ